MAIGGPSSYVPTINEFCPSWVYVNDAVGGTGLVLPGGATVAILQALGGSLASDASDVSDKNNDRELASALGAILRRENLDTVVVFNKMVRSDLSGTEYVKALPRAPLIGAAPGKFIKPARDVLSLWNKINSATIPGFTGPLVLPDDFTLEDYTVKVADLEKAFRELDAAELHVKLALAKRNVNQDKAYAIMKKYREVILARFDKDDPIVVTLPRLTPLPGSTPDPVVATGAWVEGEQKAKITWSASEESDLQHYEVRWSAGNTYDTKQDIVLTTRLPGAPLEFLTLQGMALPGSSSVFKVYVVLNSGNECGSNTVKIIRPD